MKIALVVIGMLLCPTALADGYAQSNKDKSMDEIIRDALEKQKRDQAAEKAARESAGQIKACEECPTPVPAPPPPPAKPKPKAKPKPVPVAPPTPVPAPPPVAPRPVPAPQVVYAPPPEVETGLGTRVDIGPAFIAGSGSSFGLALDVTWFFQPRFALNTKLGGVRVVNSTLDDLGVEEDLDRLYGSVGILYKATPVVWVGANVEGIGRFSPDLSTKRAANAVLDLRFKNFVVEGSVGYSFGPEKDRLMEPGFQYGVAVSVPFTVNN